MQRDTVPFLNFLFCVYLKEAMCCSLYVYMIVSVYKKKKPITFVCRCFALIESSTLEQTREEMETEKMTHLESLVELGLSSTFSTILTQCSMEIFKVFALPTSWPLSHCLVFIHV